MIPNLPTDIDQIKGFLAEDEAQALYQSALELSAYGPVLEIGSYCGKSTLYLGLANIRRAGLDDVVVPVVAGSEAAARHWQTPLAMVFIDGGHSMEAALTDYRCWTAHLMRGGVLAIHDLFEDAHEGGQAPYAIYRMAQASGLFEDIGRVNSLGLLRRL